MSGCVQSVGLKMWQFNRQNEFVCNIQFLRKTIAKDHHKNIHVQIEYEFSDHSVVQIAGHTYHKYTWFLHVLIEYVLLDYSVLQIVCHTDYKHTWHLHVQIEYVW